MDKRSAEIQEWIEDYSVALLQRAMFLLSDRQEAEDIVQEVFVAAFEAYPSFKRDSQPKTWLMGILQFKVADFYRKKYRQTGKISLDHFFDAAGSWKSTDLLEPWEESESNLLDDTAFKAKLDDCLAALPPKWLIPVKLYYLEAKKAPVVCQETGVTTTNLWKILQRSRVQLRECLEFNWFRKHD